MRPSKGMETYNNCIRCQIDAIYICRDYASGRSLSEGLGERRGGCQQITLHKSVILRQTTIWGVQDERRVHKSWSWHWAEFEGHAESARSDPGAGEVVDGWEGRRHECTVYVCHARVTMLADSHR